MLQGIDPIEAAQRLVPTDLDDPAALRTPEVAQAASRVAVLPDVRTALVDFQRAFAARDGGAVLDGRDIGTVICPEAPVKLYVTATAEERARRRWQELKAAGHDSDLATVLADVRMRDARDSERAVAPMKAAPDAVEIDTSDLSIKDAVGVAADHVQRILSR